MEPLLAAVVGAFTGFGAGAIHTGLHGRWWVSVPAGALGGLAGRALGADSLTDVLAGSSLAAVAVAACVGGGIAGFLAVAGHALARRSRR